MKKKKPLRLTGYFVFITIILLLYPCQAFSQLTTPPIVHDTTLGGTGGPAPLNPFTNNYYIPESMGKPSGDNLFHSFSEFGIPEGNTATFTATNSFKNVISRVTGLKTSYIYGGLISAIPDANFWFLNPNGVFFGPGASITVDGMFYVGASNVLVFGNNETLAATGNSPILSSEPPESFGFFGNVDAKITVEGTALDTAYLEVPNGISLTAYEIIMQTNAYIVVDTADGSKGGDVVLQAENNIALDNAFIFADTYGDGEGGSIDITAGGTLSLVGGTQVRTASFGTQVLCADICDGKGGAININAKDILLSAGSWLYADTYEKGAGGTIDITATGSLNLDTSAMITASTKNSILWQGDENPTITAGEGAGGSIIIKAEAIYLKNQSYILAESWDEGTGGVINIFGKDYDPDSSPAATTTILSMESGSRISANVGGSGAGGEIKIVADEISMMSSFILSETTGLGAGGKIDITTGNLTMDFLTNISTSTTSAFTTGVGGDIKIIADDIFMTGARIRADAGGSGAGEKAGAGGTIDITTGSLTMESSARISSSTYGAILINNGDGGDIKIIAHDISLSGAFMVADTGGTGAGGTIDIETDTLKLEGGAITASTQFINQGGDIKILANDISMTGAFLIAETRHSGNAGSIDIETSALTLEGGAVISAETFIGTGDSGDIKIIADDISLLSFSIIKATSGDPRIPCIDCGDAGSIDIESATLLMDSGFISITSTGWGNGGDVNIAAGQIDLLSGSSITAEFKFDDPFNFNILPTATDLIGGTITITATASTMNLEGGSSISSNTFTPSAAGKISINNFEFMTLIDSEITSSSEGTGDAGNIEILGATEINMFTSAIKTEALDGGGGGIHIEATDMLYMVDSEISTSVFGGDGEGGDIFIDPIFIILHNSIIRANSLGGAGGDIVLIADHLFVSPDSIIEAVSGVGVNGSISGDSPEGDTTAGTAALKASYQDSSKLLKKSCSLQGAADNAGSLVVAKSRGLPASPEEMLMAYDPSIIDKKSSSYALASAIANAGERFKPVQVASANALQKGNKAFRGGDYDTAEEELKTAASLLSGTDNKATRGATLQKLGQTQQALGKYEESLASLNESLKIANETGEKVKQASILSSMGNANIALGKTVEAEKLLTRGMMVAQKTENPKIVTSSLNNLGNLYTSMGKHEQAMVLYRKSAESAKASGEKIVFAKAVSNEARAALSAGKIDSVRKLLEGARQWIQSVDDATEKAYILVHLAKSYELLAEQSSEHRALGLMGAHETLHSAIDVSLAINETRALSYAQGNLGKLYQNSQRYMEAMYLTRQALNSALLAEAPESIYRWHWQEGKILWEIGQKQSAIDSYKRAVKILDDTKQETMARYASSAGYFNKVISPVYLDLVDALIQIGQSSEVTDQAAQTLLEARNIMEQLKAAELREYFKDECVAEFESKATGLDTVSKNAAIVYPIMLPDRLDILVSLPSGMKRYSTKVESEDLTKGIKKFRRYLQSPDNDNYLEYAQKLYDILVRPYEQDMEKEGINTMVFLPHDALHSIPMSALHDGEKFLVQKYALAVTPSLALVDPKPLDRSRIKILMAGISESRLGMPALPAIPNEVASIQNLLGGDVLLNESFTVDSFKSALSDKEVSIVHIASHGSFTGNENGNFLLAYDGKLSINQLNKSIGQTKFRKNPVELLVLSACQTAVGDEKAALGLAGAAIQAGARSVMGSLWSVSDEGTAQLVEEFYRQLKDPSISKAQALQRAQTQLIQKQTFQHPYFWSPFLMINNWL